MIGCVLVACGMEEAAVVAKSIPPTLSRGMEHGALNDQARCCDGGFEAWSQRRGVGCLTSFPPRRILHGRAAILILMSPHVCRRTIFTTCSPPSLRLLRLPTILAPPPLPLHPLFCLPINLDFVRIHLSRPLSPPPSYSTSWGTSPSCPPCLLGGSSKVSPPLRIDSLAALKKQEGWSLHTNSIPINVG